MSVLEQHKRSPVCRGDATKILEDCLRERCARVRAVNVQRAFHACSVFIIFFSQSIYLSLAALESRLYSSILPNFDEDAGFRNISVSNVAIEEFFLTGAVSTPFGYLAHGHGLKLAIPQVSP